MSLLISRPPLQAVINAHSACTHNRASLLHSRRCGCFYCLSVFTSDRIGEWISGEDTALCPFCGIDSVIPDSDKHPVTLEFLIGMREYWFGCGGKPLGEAYILGANRFDFQTKTRIASRGIVVEGSRILLSYEEKNDLYVTPGGGNEPFETAEACCVREIREETGYDVEPGSAVITVNEFYEDCLYVTHYLICRVIGTGQPSPTASEQSRGLRPLWTDVNEFIRITSRHADYDGINEEKRGIYLREFTALTRYSEVCV